MMEDQDLAGGQRRAEAAQWFARLKTLPVSKGTLDDFFDWRRDPANAEAFAEAERIWGEAGRIGARPAMLRLTQEAMTRGAARTSRLPMIAALAVGVLALCVAVMAMRWPVLRPQHEQYQTSIGEQRALALSDGSKVHLNTDTQLGAALDGGVRRVRLDRGEALFDVAHDRAHPFLVTAGAVEIRATGTRFDVRRLGSRTIVTLYEGGVIVTMPGAGPVKLVPGQQWRSGMPAKEAIRPVDAGQALAWTEGRVVFDATPLDQAVAEINRYTARKILLETKAHASDPISGSFTPHDPTGFLKSVSSLLPLETVSRPGGAIALKDAKPIPD